MSARTYALVQAGVRARLGVERSASQLLDCWVALVKECEECYSWDISEYDQEIEVRDRLGDILSATELRRFAEHKDLEREVHRVDARFRALLIPGATLAGKASWWRAGILRRAGRDYAQFIRGAHGIEVDLCEP